ncbi:MAG: tetratricopeptide repeat protein [Verrucomicrobiia bacterium]|jgi:tetratricopeptide (TPR) repeat protein
MIISRIKLVGVALVIVAATVWLYWPCNHGGFLRVDDLEYLRQSVRWNGLTWNAVKTAFTTTPMYYHPLPRLFYALSYQIWGTNAAGHHATSVFLHALNAALVFGFLWTLLGATSLTTGERLSVALWVTVVFAIHPLQAESVAWMSVRSQLLCTMFCIGSIWAYVAGGRWPVVWGLYLAALLCKPMAVSLPFVMLAIDYFPLRRHERLGWGRLVWEKAAMIAVAGLVGVATTITDRGVGPIAPVFVAPLSVRVLRVFESLTFYLVKLVWPAHLSPTYVADLPLGPWTDLPSVFAVLMITAVAVRERRRRPMLAAAWGAYVMLLLPMSAILPRGRQALATRYAYVAMLPVLLVAGAAGVWVWRRSARAGRGALVGLLACELFAFAAGTRRLIPDWHDEEAKHRAALAEFPDSQQVNRELAAELLDQGRASEALVYAQRSVEIAPQVCDGHVVLGLVLCRLGRLPEAITYYEQALWINPDYADAHYDLGVALAQTGKIEEAIAHFEQALRVNPDYAQAHYNLGVALAQTGKIEEAIVHYEQALRINPDDAEAHYNLGVVLARTGKTKEAIAHFEQALRIKPDSAEAHYNLGKAFLQEGRLREAIVHLEQTIRIKPDYAAAHYNLGNALARTGKIEEAIAHFEQALRIKPDYADVQNDLAWLLATRGPSEGGDPVRAVTLAERACAQTGNSAFPYLDTLAAAYAAAGRFQEAVATAQKAIDLARAAGQTQAANEIMPRLELYRNAHAYREATDVMKGSLAQ